MAFVKLDCKILNSSLWCDRDAREIFITALLMARPEAFDTSMPQLNVRSLDPTGWSIPEGQYGFVDAAGVGIIRQAGLDVEVGLAALERLGNPEAESGSKDFDGRRMVRIDGGYIVLNYMKYRDFDYTAADRARRYREGKKAVNVTRDSHGVTRDSHAKTRDVTHAEAEADAEADQKEKQAKESPPQPPEGEFVFPENLKTEEFQKAWDDWVQYRKERKPKVTATTATRQLKKLSALGPAEAIRWIDAAITNSWQGLYPPPESRSGNGHDKNVTAAEFYERLKGLDPEDMDGTAIRVQQVLAVYPDFVGWEVLRLIGQEYRTTRSFENLAKNLEGEYARQQAAIRAQHERP